METQILSSFQETEVFPRMTGFLYKGCTFSARQYSVTIFQKLILPLFAMQLRLTKAFHGTTFVFYCLVKTLSLKKIISYDVDNSIHRL